MIEVVDLKQEKQSSCRVMICQMDSNEYDWNEESGLHFLVNNDKIRNKVIEFLKLAKHNSVDIILFPELSIPEKLVKMIQEWSAEHEAVVVCGSHYHKKADSYISRSPIIVQGRVFFY